MRGKILFGRYEIIEPLGQGGFSSTYIAKDLQDGFLCVVKHLCPVSSDPGFLKEATRLFKKEAETLEKLNGHPQIPRIFNYFEEQDQFYLIQELIQGQTLSSRLSREERPWSEFEVVEFLKDTLKILEYIHGLGVIHRDIKPDNLILRQQDSKFVLIDFGSVKEFQPQQSQLVSQTIAIGTRGYMPLEQIKGKPRKNSDLYALGIIAIQALTGRHPIDLEENAQGELIWQTHARVSPRLAGILQKMIAPDCRQRYPSATEVLQDLDRPETVLPPTNPEPRIPEPAPPPITPMDGKFSTWLKSPAANNIGFALGLGIIATMGIYYLGAKEKADKLLKIQQTVERLESDIKSEQFDRCFEDSKSEETKAIGIPETTLNQITVDCGLGRAEVLAKQSKFGEALEKLNEIPTGTDQDSRIAQQADAWSRDLLAGASRSYGQEGNLQEALEMLGAVPANSRFRSDADLLAREWKAESERYEAIFNKAKFALETQNYRQAIEYAREITHADPAPSEHWLLKGKEIAETAHKEMTKNSGPGRSNPGGLPSTPGPAATKNDPQHPPENPKGIEVPPELR